MAHEYEELRSFLSLSIMRSEKGRLFILSTESEYMDILVLFAI